MKIHPVGILSFQVDGQIW